MWKLLLRDCCLPEDDRGRSSIAYQNYPNTGQRIAVIEGQFRVYNNADLLLSRDIFGPHTGPAQAQAELDMLITIIARQRTCILSLARGWFPRI